MQSWAEDKDGGRVLKCSVTAAPEKGKANQALIELLAKNLKIPKTSLRVSGGETNKLKTLEIIGELKNMDDFFAHLKN